MNPMVPYEGWIWCGSAYHFVASDKCLYHLCTRVGRFRISTVGDYYPDLGRQLNPERRTLSLADDAFFETMVFRVVDSPGDPCGETVDWSEVEARHWPTVTEANAGHLRMCGMYAVHPEQEMVADETP